MNHLADLLPGFESHHIAGEEGTIFARSGGSGPLLVLLHGFPQTHVMWHRLAPDLAKRFRVVAMDLRGYGWSAAPRSEGGRLYAKREMARDVLRVVDQLGGVRFSLVGHDRGARVAYRLALDHPGRVEKLAILDIIPTLAMWEGMDARRAMQVYHWSFLAQPAPMPETLIRGAHQEWLDHTLASWTEDKTLKAFDARALAHYRAFFADPARIHATCEDYRAGATLDLAADHESRAKGETIACPVHVLWGEAGIPAGGASPLDAWKVFAPKVAGEAIAGGHFLPEENPAATLAALEPFL
jgi:haloacetate dehalogenase